MLTTAERYNTRHYHNQTRLHETNYCLLLQLLPSVRELDESTHLAFGHHLRIEIRERSRYTSVLTLKLPMAHFLPLIPELTLIVRVYHDAKVAEATHFQGHGRFKTIYSHPNAMCYHVDEKHQANRLLQECLAYCLKRRGPAAVSSQ